MRSSSRLIAAFLAIFAMFALSLAGSATADVSERARAEHKVRGLKASEIRNTGKFYVKGRVLTARKKVVKLQKRKCDKCAYKATAKKRTTASGRFRINFDGPSGTCYRIVVPATRKYRTFVREVGCIVTR